MATLDKMYADMEGFIRGYIDTTTCTACALYATRLLDPSRNFDFLQRTRNAVAGTWSTSKYVAELDARLAPMTKWIGEFAPDIRLPDVDGKMTPLSSLRGKYVLLDFWASWCAPCRGENPNVVRLYNKYKSRGFTVYSVSLDGGQTRTGRSEWLAAIKADRLTWDAHVSDLQGWQSPVAQLYEINGIPASFLLDKEGRIIAKDLRGQVLERKLAELFGS
jgi:thiol-disulfide isomerase/thioredoxin